jgi:hypothetical protein
VVYKTGSERPKQTLERKYSFLGIIATAAGSRSTIAVVTAVDEIVQGLVHNVTRKTSAMHRNQLIEILLRYLYNVSQVTFSTLFVHILRDSSS